MANGQHTLLSLLNNNLKLPGQDMKQFAADVRGLGTEDRNWYAHAFIQGGYADAVVVSEIINGEKIDHIVKM